MSRLPAFAMASSLALLAACATTPEDKPDYQAPLYRTGSHLPVRDASAPTQVQSVDPQSIDRLRSPGMPSTVRGN